MGMDLSTTIGPYIKISGKRETTVIKIKRLCPKHPNKEQDGKFCTHCGTEIENVEVPKVEKVYPMGLLHKNDEWDDDLWSPEGMDHIIIPNERPPQKIRIDDQDNDVADLTDIDLERVKSTQIEWFKNKFQPAVDVLADALGVENVQVKWGIVTYWS